MVFFTAKKQLTRRVRLSDRYITDRYLPDKAIDVMDEAGARVHLANIKVPKEILQLEEEIEKSAVKKSSCKKSKTLRKLRVCVIWKRNY